MAGISPFSSHATDIPIPRAMAPVFLLSRVWPSRILKIVVCEQPAALATAGWLMPSCSIA